MAKSKSRSRSSGSRFRKAWRDVETYPSYPIARTPLPRRYLTPLSVVEDFRRYHPHANRRHYRRVDASLVLSRSRVGYFLRSTLRRRPFIDRRRLRQLSMAVVRTLPRDAVVCAKRNVRKEVIFAMNKAGRGGQRRPRRNENSNVVCKR